MSFRSSLAASQADQNQPPMTTLRVAASQLGDAASERLKDGVGSYLC